MTLGDTLHRSPPITTSLRSSVLTAGHVADPLSHCLGTWPTHFRTTWEVPATGPPAKRVGGKRPIWDSVIDDSAAPVPSGWYGCWD